MFVPLAAELVIVVGEPELVEIKPYPEVLLAES